MQVAPPGLLDTGGALEPQFSKVDRRLVPSITAGDWVAPAVKPVLPSQQTAGGSAGAGAVASATSSGRALLARTLTTALPGATARSNRSSTSDAEPVGARTPVKTRTASSRSAPVLARAAWSVTVVGSAFGAVATYDSAVGTVQVG